MPPIQILPEALSNKIAAGEVVERPASVVKELVENALDAEASRLRIEIEKGGRALIQVADDGCGMNSDEALLAIERYATSKISSDHDLAAIRTLGFRGEALPSIAAVSRFSLESRPATADVGTRVEITGGKLVKVSDSGVPVGTMVSVAQLFYNIPARRKFLKSITTEMGHITDTMARFALGYPAVRIKLRHNGRTVKDWPAGADGRRRAGQVLGKDLAKQLVAIAAETPHLKLTGWLALPRVTRTTARGIYCFINGRFVRDNVLRQALLEGYRGRLMKGQYPLAILFVTVPFESVDVNVHPTKHEVRFVRPQAIHDGVAAAVAGTLARAEAPLWQVPETNGNRPEGAPRPPQVAEKRAVFNTPPEPSFQKAMDHRIEAPGDQSATAQSPKKDRPTPSPSQEPPARHQQPLWQRPQETAIEVIGQLRGTYILCQSPGGLLIVDQHAAHERVRYERLQQRLADGRGTAQRLLLPETFDLSQREAAIFEALLDGLNTLGFEISPFGGTTFAVRAVPSLLGAAEAAPILRDVAEHVAESGLRARLDKALQASLTVIACHSSLRARQNLSSAEMRALIGQLLQCRNPAHCPHGRPTWVELETKALERRFGRIV
jgi:DNA mismatch repair protein MutL